MTEENRDRLLGEAAISEGRKIWNTEQGITKSEGRRIRNTEQGISKSKVYVGGVEV